MNIISIASCTTNCWAQLAKIVHDKWGIEGGLMLTIHALTATQLAVDGASKGGKYWSAGRTASVNVIPSTTGAAKAVPVGGVIKELKVKLTGIAFRVLAVDVSCVNLTVRMKRADMYAEICKEIKRASQKGIEGNMGYTEDKVASSDFIGSSYSSIFDAKAGLMLSLQDFIN